MAHVPRGGGSNSAPTGVPFRILGFIEVLATGEVNAPVHWPHVVPTFRGSREANGLQEGVKHTSPRT